MKYIVIALIILGILFWCGCQSSGRGLTEADKEMMRANPHQMINN
jgi:PBP1b-binding outer membrane lipoprotein LpoB